MIQMNKLSRIKKALDNLSMKTKILFALIIVSMLTSFIAGVTSYYASLKYNEREAVNSSRQIINLISGNLNAILDSIDTTLVTFTINDEVVDYFANASSDSEYDKVQRTRVLEKILRNTVYPRSIIENVLCYPIEGYSISIGDINTSLLKNFRTFEVYKKAMGDRGKSVWFGIHDFEGNDQGHNVTHIISVARKVKRIGVDNVLGVIEIQISEESFYELFKLLNDVNNSGIIVYDSEGNIVTGDRNSKNIPEDYFEPVKGTLLKNLSGTTVNRLADADNKYLFNFVTLKNGWKIVHFQPYDNLIHASLAAGKVILIAEIILIAAISCVALVLSNNLIKPLKQFISFSGRAKDGQAEDIGEISANNEFGHLYSNYHVMLRKIKESELDTLRAQITPHFLYNTLNSIKCRAFLDKNELIAKMTEALIDLLELSINNPNEYITLRQELKIVDSYILLQQSRQDGRFTVRYDAPEELLDYLIPKMLLQPIVENSILHGFAEIESAAEIRIAISRDGRDLQIKICDNGIGMSEEQINLILNRQDARQKMKFSRIGVKNVNERIKLYFGKEYGLEICSETGRGTTVVIRIPCVVDPEEMINKG